MPMKVLLISLLILSFLGISTLAFVTMDHGNSSVFKNCATEMATGLNCPANPLAFADFHLNLFRIFSSVYFGNFLNVYLVLLAFLLLGLTLDIFRRNSLSTGKFRYAWFKHFFKSFLPLVESKTSHWFSLHENSPTAQ